MVKQHHQLNGHESEQNLGDSKGQGHLAYCKEQDTTQHLNKNELLILKETLMSFIYCKNANNVEQHKEESEVTNLNSLRFKTS